MVGGKFWLSKHTFTTNKQKGGGQEGGGGDTGIPAECLSRGEKKEKSLCFLCQNVRRSKVTLNNGLFSFHSGPVLKAVSLI